MGHLLSLSLLNTQTWRDVVASIGAGGSEGDVAGLASKAAGRALSEAADDLAFQAVAELFVELPLAARGPGFCSYLAENGVLRTP